MEDQPTNPSGLSPDVPAKLRRSHRMPVGKARRRTIVEPGAGTEGALEAPEANTDTDPTIADTTDGQASDETLADSETSTPSVFVAVDDTEGADTTDESAAEDADADSETSTPPVFVAVDDTEGADTADELVFVERKPVGKWLKAAVVATAVLFVAAAGFAGATAQPYLADRALVAIKREVASTAANAITSLFTYSPQDMEALPDRASQFLSGEFEAAYRQYVDGISAANKQAQVSNETLVLGAAVESIGPSDATAIVYTNSTATSPLTKGIPSLRYVSYRLAMERHGPKWLVTKMSTITSLDLTPQL